MPTLPLPPPEPTPAPALRVPKIQAPTVSQEEAPNAVPPLRVQENHPPVVSQEEEEPEEETDLYEFEKILHHKYAPKGSGSAYQVKVQWKNHPPSYVPVNTFTDRNLNIQAAEAVAVYAQKNNLLQTKGWKAFQHFLPIQTESASNVTFTENRPKHALTKKQKIFFQDAHYAMLAKQQANKAINPDTGELAEYPVLLKSTDGEHWEESCCEEVGRLAQGYPPNIQGTDTMHFIQFSAVPTGRTATYLRLVVADRPTKSNPRRVRFTVGGDKVNYPGDASTKVADLPTAKILINSVISTPGARFMGIDIKDFYLNNPMDRYEYMRMPTNCIPKKIFDLCNLGPLVHKGAVYVEIRKGMCGLPQAGRLASDVLIPILQKAGHHQSETTPGLFKHETRPIAFCLVVDDFGVKYVGKEHAEHLIQTLKEANYKITTDWEGTKFCGIDLKWDYENGTVDLSMNDYVEKALQRFEHPNPNKPEDSPHDWTAPQYGSKQQLTAQPDNSPQLDKLGLKRLQEVTGTLLYYGRAIDSTMLVALGSLAAAQSKGTKATMKACTKLLNYAATHPDAVIRFTRSGMILHIHSDASHLSEPKARSRAGGIFCLSDQHVEPSPHAPPPKINGAVHIISKIMTNVMASATEAEVGALFHNAQDACMLRNTLEFLGHPQPATPIQTDNSCANGIANDTVKQRRSKAIDMRFYWLKDRVRQKQFNIFWRPGKTNRADYFTKHHPASHHREMRPIYLHVEQANLLAQCQC